MLPPRTGGPSFGGVRRGGGIGTRDFGESVGGVGGRRDFVSRRQERRGGRQVRRERAGGGRRRGIFRAKIDEDGEGKNNDYGAKDDEDERRRGPTEEEGAGGDAGGGLFRRRDNDPALVLPGEALEAVPTPRMYLEAARFLRVRIRSLVDSGDDAGADRPGGGEEDVSYLVNEGEDATGSGEASRRPSSRR